MNLSIPRPGRLGIMALALVYTGLVFGAAITPAPAYAAGGAYYTAELATPADEARVVASGVAWRCEGTTCKAGQGTSRALRICRGLNREFGQVVNFTADGKLLSEDELAKCNS
ncbi:MAG: hypothetical protein C0510_03475 [Erythrobacter sp.]|nr:hypothetical protein [Erythrobacter sp.]